MNDKLLKQGIWVLFLSLLFAAASIMFTNLNYPVQSQGQLVFSQTFRHGGEVDKIILTSKEKTITLAHMDGYWRIAETGGYYANTRLVSKLLQNINDAVFLMQRPYSKENLQKSGLGQGQCLNIETYAGEQKLDNVCIGRRTTAQTAFAAVSGKNEIWQISGNWQLPEDQASWFLQPLLELPSSMVESLQVDDIKVSRTSPFADFVYPDGKAALVKAFLENFAWLPSVEVVPSFGFDRSKFPDVKNIILTSFDGLIVRLTLSCNNQDYWGSITLSTTPLPTSAVNAYIRDNAFLYEDWYFKIPSSAGKALFSYKLMPQKE